MIWRSVIPMSFVENVHLSDSLMTLCYRMSNKSEDIPRDLISFAAKSPNQRFSQIKLPLSLLNTIY